MKSINKQYRNNKLFSTTNNINQSVQDNPFVNEVKKKLNEIKDKDGKSLLVIIKL